MEFIHLGDQFFQPIIFRVTQWATAKSREAGPEDHAVVSIFWRRDHLFFETTRRFVDHEKGEPVRDVILSGAERSRRTPLCCLRGCSTGFLDCVPLRCTPLGMTAPFLKRVVRRLLFALVFVKTL